MEFSPQIILIIIAGVAIGWVLSYFKSLFVIRRHKNELEQYKEHLNRQMKITNEGQKSLEVELTKLQKENENLRISVKTLGQKPGAAELRLLNIYDSALRIMMLKSPLFSSAWGSALQEAEREYEQNEAGFKTIIKKVFGQNTIPHQNQHIQAMKDDAKDAVV
ncbi:MAG: hypothetical protein U9N42_08420 [Campylobacterota bacterium]|nr:hypothetical protein [Campylobacterota bacterium]